MITYTELRLYTTDAATDFTILPNYSTLTFDAKYNDIGAIEFEYPLVAAQSLGLTDGSLVGVVCGFSDGTSDEVERYYVYGTNDEKVTDGVRLRTLTGRSTLASLEDAVVYPSNWPVTSPTGHSFTDMTVGNIFRTLVLRAKNRGALPNLVETSFSGTQDSAGSVWADLHTQNYASGTTYLSVLTDFMDRGYVDARLDGWDLVLLNGGAMGNHVDQATVEIRPAKNATEMVTQTNSDESATTVLIEGEEGTVVERHSATAETLLKRRRERYVSQGGIQDAGVLTLLGDAELELYGRIPVEETVGITSAGGLTPFKDFGPSDWIWVRYATDQPATERRVRQLAVSIDENREVQVAATLNTILYESDIKLQRKVEAYAGSGGNYGSTPNSGVDVTVPNAPTTLAATSGYYISDVTGEYEGAATFSWVAPTTNVDGSPVNDLGGYQLQWRYQGDTNWSPLYPSQDEVFQYSPYQIGRTIEVRVRALDQSGHTSAWTATLTHVLDTDTDPPETPSNPSTSENLQSGVEVEWDGLSFTAGLMPADLHRVEIWRSLSTGFTPPTGATMVGQFQPGGGTFLDASPVTGSTYYYKLVAVDRAGNKSAASGQDVGVKQLDATDGLPPDEVPVLTARSSIASVFLKWNFIANPDPVEYTVHAGTVTGFTPTAANALATTTSNVATVSAFADGTPFSYDVDTFFRVVPSDGDGDGPASNSASARPIKIDFDDLMQAVIDAIETANENANNAVTSANGKNAIWYSPTAPVAPVDAPHSHDDVWFDTDDGFKPYSWDANLATPDWVAREWGHQSIATIDIGKATVGFLAAARLEAYSISADKLMIGVGENRVLNPGWEDSAEGLPHFPNPGAGAFWVGQSALSRSGAYGGQYQLPLDVTAATVGLYVSGHSSDPAKHLQVKLGDHVRAELWMRDAGVGTPPILRAWILTYNSAGALVGGNRFMSVDFTPTAEYRDILNAAEIEITDPAASHCLIRVDVVSGLAGQSFIVDDADLREMTPGHLLVNGTITTRELDAKAVSAEYLIAEQALIGALDTVDLSSTTLTGATIQTVVEEKRGVKINESGLYVYDTTGRPFITAEPASGMAVIAGEMKAITLTVSSEDPLAPAGSSLGGTTELPVNSTMEMHTVTQPPKSAPSMVTSYDSIQYGDQYSWATRYGWTTDGTYYYSVRSDGSVEKWGLTGGWVATNRLSGMYPNEKAYGIVAGAAGELHVLTLDTDNGWYVWHVNSATLVGTTSNISWWTDNDGGAKTLGYIPALGFDAVNNRVIIAQPRKDNGNKIRFQHFNAGRMYYDVPNLTHNTTFAYGTSLSTCIYTSADFGGTRYVVGSRQDAQANDWLSISTAGAMVPNEHWPSGMTSRVGMTWRDGAFRAVDQAGTMRTYTGVVGDLNQLKKWASTTFARGTPFYQTPESPVSSIVMPRRSKLTIAASSVPAGTGSATDPDRIRFYLGSGAANPGRAGRFLQSAPGPGVNTITLSSVAGSGAVPPTSNTFPTTGVPALIKSAALRSDGKPKIFLDGSGSGNIDGLIPPGSIQMFAGTVLPPGWFWCNGAQVTQAAWPDLYATIGTAFSTGNEAAGYFRLPNFTTRFPMGMGAVGAVGGSAFISEANLPVHDHLAGTLTAASNGAHDHNLRRTASPGGRFNTYPTGNQTEELSTPAVMDGQAGAHGHSVTGATANAGSGSAYYQPYLRINFIIKA